MWINAKRSRKYQTKDAITCISLGILSYIIGIAGAGVKGYFYLLVYNHYRLINFDTMTGASLFLSIILLVVLQDLGYYWFHRAAHRINFLWGGHIVHHSSEEYNLAVAIRQSSIQQFTSWPIYLPIALLGYPASWFVTVASLNLVYQFWIHTLQINKMPIWFESVFNTPSHHRVHHGTNKQYIDKNYAGMFIIWDRIFHSFEPEVEEVKYGITEPVNSHNLLWINIHYFVHLAKLSFNSPSLKDSIFIWFAPPDHKPEWISHLLMTSNTSET